MAAMAGVTDPVAVQAISAETKGEAAGAMKVDPAPIAAPATAAPSSSAEAAPVCVWPPLPERFLHHMLLRM